MSCLAQYFQSAGSKTDAENVQLQRCHTDAHSCFFSHWGPVMNTHICKLTVTCSNNGLSPGQRQAIVWTYAGILLIGPSGTNLMKS